MAKDNPRGAGDLDPIGDSSETSHAADEPTAVWDVEALRKAGLSEVLDAPETPATSPATPAVGIELERPSIIVEQEATRPGSPRPAPAARHAAVRKAARSDVGWVGLVAIAALLGAIAYVVIRLLR